MSETGAGLPSAARVGAGDFAGSDTVHTGDGSVVILRGPITLENATALHDFVAARMAEHMEQVWPWPSAGALEQHIANRVQAAHTHGAFTAALDAGDIPAAAQYLAHLAGMASAWAEHPDYPLRPR